MTKYNTLLTEMQPRIRPFTALELSNICAGLGDSKEAQAWRQEAEEAQAVKVVCAWCGVTIKEGPSDRLSHGICNRCFAVEMADAA